MFYLKEFRSKFEINLYPKLSCEIHPRRHLLNINIAYEIPVPTGQNPRSEEQKNPNAINSNRTSAVVPTMADLLRMARGTKGPHVNPSEH